MNVEECCLLPESEKETRARKQKLMLVATLGLVQGHSSPQGNERAAVCLPGERNSVNEAVCMQSYKIRDGLGEEQMCVVLTQLSVCFCCSLPA